MNAKSLVAREIANRATRWWHERRLIAEIFAEQHTMASTSNSSSVEIAKLALWLHSRGRNAPLSALEHTIRFGNSLVGPDCWSMIANTAENQARINPFDWGDERYDIVLGNPPYVDFQNLMSVDPRW